MEKVVITGVGVASPLGLDVRSFWARLLNGESAVVALDDPKMVEAKVPIGAYMKNYSPEDHFARKEVRRSSRASQLAMIAVKEAIHQAGIADSKVNRQDVGVMIGSSIGGFQASDPFFEGYYKKGRRSPLVIPLSMNYGPSSYISMKYGFQGPVMTTDAACASAAHSIGHAYNMIRSGALDIAVSGGSDTPFAPAVMAAWESMKALSTRHDQPATACRPFSKDRDGLVLGEGAGIVVLESLTSARRRGAPILAKLLGYGASADSHHLTRPSASGMALALRRALKSADLTTDNVDHINAHGTGTLFNDSTETSAIKDVFGETAYQIPIVSSKAALGHSIGASGGLELVASIMALQEQVLPPTINYQVSDPECDLDYVVDGCRKLELRHILSNSFAFGGSNGVLAIGRAPLKGS
jgi:beta-ketoacyl-acyl-carrier-protein synthase II